MPYFEEFPFKMKKEFMAQTFTGIWNILSEKGQQLLQKRSDQITVICKSWYGNIHKCMFRVIPI
jgi:hypothetical protein